MHSGGKGQCHMSCHGWLSPVSLGFSLCPDGVSEEHANIWGTWHATLKPTLKDQQHFSGKSLSTNSTGHVTQTVICFPHPSSSRFPRQCLGREFTQLAGRSGRVPCRRQAAAGEGPPGSCQGMHGPSRAPQQWQRTLQAARGRLWHSTSTPPPPPAAGTVTELATTCWGSAAPPPPRAATATAAAAREGERSAINRGGPRGGATTTEPRVAGLAAGALADLAAAVIGQCRHAS